jgi:hypothetical protein
MAQDGKPKLALVGASLEGFVKGLKTFIGMASQAKNIFQIDRRTKPKLGLVVQNHAGAEIFCQVCHDAMPGESKCSECIFYRIHVTFHSPA